MYEESNLGPLVLESNALPAELYTCVDDLRPSLVEELLDNNRVSFFPELALKVNKKGFGIIGDQLLQFN